MSIELFLSLLGCALGFLGCAFAFVAFFSPALVLKFLVRHPSHWVKIKYLPGFKDAYRHKYFSGFMIDIHEEQDDFDHRLGFEEGWMSPFSNYHKETNRQVPVIFSFNGLPLLVETFVKFDEFRWFVPMPKRESCEFAFRYSFTDFQKNVAQIVGSTYRESLEDFFLIVERYSEIHFGLLGCDADLKLREVELEAKIKKAKGRHDTNSLGCR